MNSSSGLLAAVTCDELMLLSSVLNNHEFPPIVSVLDQSCSSLFELNSDWVDLRYPLSSEAVLQQVITRMNWKHVAIFYDDDEGKKME